MLPEQRVNIFSRIFFNWMSPTMSTGWKRPLMPNDIFTLDRTLQSNIQSARLTEYITAHPSNNTTNNDSNSNSNSSADSNDVQPPAKPPRRPTLVGGLWYCYKYPFLASGALRVAGMLLRVSLPLVVGNITQFAQDSHDAQKKHQMHEAPNLWAGLQNVILYAFIIILAMIMNQHSAHFANRVATAARSVMTSHIFTKSLVVSNAVRSEVSPGMVMNMMSTDAGIISRGISMFHNGWIAIVQLFVAVYLLFKTMGVSGLAGTAVMTLTIPIQTVMLIVSVRTRKRVVQVTDERVKITRESLQGMRGVKYCTWEQALLKRITNLRIRELRMIRKIVFYQASSEVASMIVPAIAAVITFAMYSSEGTGHELKASKVFVALSLLNSVRGPLASLPNIFTALAIAKVSYDRVASYIFNAEEMPGLPQIDLASEHAIKLNNATFVWVPSQNESPPSSTTSSTATSVVSSSDNIAGNKKEIEMKKTDTSDADGDELQFEPSFKFKRVNVDIPRGSLTMIVGSAGAGKSSLLSAIIGEMQCTNGNVTLGGSISYCPQIAWIQNSTVRQNIIFNNNIDVDEERYKRVIKLCQLEHDISLMKCGDATELGESGGTLSGGQRQRISMARALYQNSDIFLLDDPLSAVDAHVGRRLFNDVIRGEMMNSESGLKTVVLVTNQLHLLPYATQILHADNGRIAGVGSLSELMESSPTFAALVNEYGGVDHNSFENDSAPRSAGKSTASDAIQSTATITATTSAAIMQIEDRETGAVAKKVYMLYISALGGVWIIVMLAVLEAITQVARVGSGLWLSAWTDNKLDKDNVFYMTGYTLWAIVMSVIDWISVMAAVWVGLNASRRLHNIALVNIFSAPMHFFDTNHCGRIINRFSKDLETLDLTLPGVMQEVLECVAAIIGSTVFIAIILPIYLAPMVPVFAFYCFLASYYRHTCREMKRIESITRSPLYSLFSESLSGTSTIRAYRIQDKVVKANHKRLDDHIAASYILLSSQRWLGFRLEISATILAVCVALFAVLNRFNLTPGLVGLVMSKGTGMTSSFARVVRMSADVENNMNVVERIGYYVEHLETEGASEKSSEAVVVRSSPSPDWPISAAIQFNNVSMRYRPDLPLVLENLSFTILAGERIGIVGRTSAGKSSIIQAILQTVPLAEGEISIDGCDLSTLDLRELRRRVAIIPQDPLIVTGTVRSNLDPYNEHTDDEMWSVLENRTSATAVTKSTAEPELEPELEPEMMDGYPLIAGLDMPVIDAGANFSIGQRQLLSLSRAMLSGAKVVLLDEASAFIDAASDAIVQKAIRTHFTGCTVIAIAHRLNSIADSDRVLVVDKGRVAEFDSPHKLLQKDGMFASMVQETGSVNAAAIRELAATKAALLLT
ncbi:hypothetical protein GQ42DRAFT_170542 [Ramicandelaber brevisporus]|nr:hypothetical protein GQ42DRAFT_170542 [Ramicandelaber brevisporus]